MDVRDRITLDAPRVWTDRYERERERILAAMDVEPLGVFHVGSTAIPDLPGKPALDVLAVFPSSEPIGDAVASLVADGYEREHEREDTAVAVRWGEDYAVFVKLHVVGDERIRSQLLFREHLRETPEARREYERVKRTAAANHPEDPQAYTQAKTDVVTKLLEAARDYDYEDRLP